MTMVTGLKKRNEVLDIFQGILYDTVKLEILFVQILCNAKAKCKKGTLSLQIYSKVSCFTWSVLQVVQAT